MIIGQRAEQIAATHAYQIMGFEGEAPSRWIIFVIFLKTKQQFYQHLDKFRTSLDPLQRTKLLRFESQLKN